MENGELKMQTGRYMIETIKPRLESPERSRKTKGEPCKPQVVAYGMKMQKRQGLSLSPI
jgi:hypothetical protein